MNKRILMIFIAILLGAVVTQGIGLYPQEVSAAFGDYYSPFDLAYSPDGTMIAVTDLTKAKLNIITASTGAIARTVSLNGQPKGLAWSGNTRVYVAEYDAGTVAEVDPSNGSILRRFTTGRKPAAVAVASGKLVVTDFGLKKVSVVDLTSGSVLGDVAVNNYPYFVEATTSGAYAIVGHATPSGNAMTAGFASSVSFIDVNARTVATNLTLPAGSGNIRKIECSPDGQWAYVLHELGRVTLPTTQITKGWVNTDALTILNVTSRTIYTTVLLDTLYEGAADPWGMAISSDSRTGWISISGTHQVLKLDLYNLHLLLTGNITGTSPTLLYRSKKNFAKPYSDIWFAIKADTNKKSLLKNNLGALWSAGLLTRVKLPGQGPRGISMSSDGTRVAVGTFFDGKVYTINTSTNAIAQTISLGTPPAEDAVRRGERTFFDASTTTQKWLSCGTCHPEGRSDGFNWDMPNDGVGNTKNTKSMYKAFEISPAMWRGIRTDAAAGVNAGFKFIKFRTPTQQELDDVAAYIQSFTAQPDPYRNTDGTMTADALAGKTLFESAGTHCSSCHSGTNLTDCTIHDVGTKDANDIDGNYVTGPIEEMWRTAPYLHDGSAATLRDVLTTRNPSNQHGATSQLTSTELDQLVAYMLQFKPGDAATSTPAPTPTPTPTAAPTATPTVTPTPTATPVNLAIGKTGSADSQQTGNEATKGNDGSISTRWCANDGNLNHWWKVDLGSSMAIASTEEMWESSGYVYKYKVETSTDNTNWTLRVDKTNNTDSSQTQRDYFSATARYVRITVTGLGSGRWASIWEFRVY